MHAAPADVLVLPPVDFVANDRSVLQPDLVVVSRSAAHQKRLHEPPLLVVEVASPCTRGYDRVHKLDAYDRGGVPAYWIVDPRDVSLTVFERDGDRLVERARVVGGEAYEATEPFVVTVVPDALVADLR